MFVNMHMKNFNLNDFQNICRACMSEGELQKLQDGHIKVLNLISKVQLSKTDELPQKICDKCVKRIDDIMAFALLCKRIDQTLKKYLENLKIENITIDLNTPERAPAEEITIVEEKIEFIDVNQEVDVETNHVQLELQRIKDELIKAEYAEATRPPSPQIVATPVVETVRALSPPRVPPKPRPYKCSHCVRTFTRPGIKRSHERKIHRVALKYRCNICGQNSPHAYALKLHRKTHTPQNVCTLCNRAFRTQYHLKGHLKSHLQDPQLEKPYECLICFKTFRLLKTYLKHNAVHRTFPCDACTRTFRSAGSLARHKRIHKS